jgi:hypothetical protein
LPFLPLHGYSPTKKTGLAYARPAIMKYYPLRGLRAKGRLIQKKSAMMRIFMRVILKNEIQGLRSPKNRSLLIVSEDFEDKHNAEVRL